MSTANPKRRDAEDTKTRILAAAAKHFGLYGFNGASLRNIVAEAGANVAAGNYHFGSKENLLVATIDHYIVSTHPRRFLLLDEADRQPLTKPRLRALIAAYLRPHYEITIGEDNVDYARLVMRVVSEETPTLQMEIDRALLPIRQRFRDSLRVCCPDADNALISRAMSLVVAVLAMGPFTIDHKSLAIGKLRRAPVEKVLDEATRFAFGGVVELLGIGDRD